MKPLVSVVTVCLNEDKLIDSTLNSIVAQQGVRKEIIVIDGGSIDGTVSIVNSYTNHLKVFISESDEGIYDAMNKGLQFATGDWVVFLNGGDQFADCYVLDSLLSNVPDTAKVVYGNRLTATGTEYPFPLQAIEYGVIPFCHQSAAFRLDFGLDAISYDLAYEIYGDYDLITRLYKYYLDAFYYVNKDVCISNPGGVSNQVSAKKRKEKYLLLYRHFGLKGVLRGMRARLGGFYMRR